MQLERTLAHKLIPCSKALSPVPTSMIIDIKEQGTLRFGIIAQHSALNPRVPSFNKLLRLNQEY